MKKQPLGGSLNLDDLRSSVGIAAEPFDRAGRGFHLELLSRQVEGEYDVSGFA